LYRKDAFLTLI